MKSLSLIKGIVLASLVAFCGGVLSSCSGEDEPGAQLDVNFSRSLSDGSESVTYEMTDIELYDKNSLTNGRWKKVNLSELCGWESSCPSTIIIQDGKVYTNYKTFYSSTGPTLIGRIWNAYKYATGKNSRLFLARDFKINESDNTIDIGGGIFTVEKVDKSRFRLIDYSEYAGGESGDGGYFKTVADYSSVAHQAIEREDLAFETVKELCQSVIDLARDEFGDVVDFNKIYSGHVIYDNPEANVIRLSEVEEILGLK